jgi:hypothetical protein
MTDTRPLTLRDALIKGARRACMVERECQWHERLADSERFRADRDRAVHSCEKLLAFAVDCGVVSERGARTLAACIYDALAIERRHVNGKAYSSDPDGHWQQRDALTAALEKAWKRDHFLRFFLVPFQG